VVSAKKTPASPIYSQESSGADKISKERICRRVTPQNLPNGTAMPLGKFQKDLRLRQGLSLMGLAPD
jgi:hypothetical protein